MSTTTVGIGEDFGIFKKKINEHTSTQNFGMYSKNVHHIKTAKHHYSTAPVPFFSKYPKIPQTNIADLGS